MVVLVIRSPTLLKDIQTIEVAAYMYFVIIPFSHIL